MKTTLKIALTLFIVLFTIALANVCVAQTIPQGKVFNLDAADKVVTTNTAILNGKKYEVYANKSGRLYIETGISKKTGKPTRKYITPAVKKD